MLVVVIGCVSVVGGGAFSIFSAYRTSVQTRAILRAQHEFSTAIGERARDNQVFAEFVAQLPNVRQAYETDNPRKLSADLLDAYLTIKTTTDINRMHFYRADNSTFVRMHRLSDSEDRDKIGLEIVSRTNRDRVPRRGIDTGPNGLRNRGIAPISDSAGRHVGAVDVATYVTPEFLRHLEQNRIFYRIFLLRRGGYQLAMESGQSTAPLLSQAAFALTNRGVDVLEHVRIGATQYISTAMPLLDYDRDNIGVVQIDIDATQIESRYDDLITVLIVATILLLLLGTVGGSIALRSLTGPVEILIKTTDRLATSTGADVQVPMLSRTDTVGRFARALENLRQSKAELDGQKRKAESANLAKVKFLAIMSHELRTPLNAIIGFSELVLNGIGVDKPSPKQSGYLEEIANSGRHLHDLLSEIMTMSRLESGDFQIMPASVDLAQFVDDVVAMMRPMAAAAGVTLSVAGQAAAPVEADPIAVRQMLLNVISNAIKFSRPGGSVRVASHNADGRAGLTVTDSGIGIPPDKLHTVVLPFEQVEDALSREKGGLGLGLSIVKTLTELHHGDLSIRSMPGEGTTVSISWPAIDARRQSTAAE